VDKINENEDDNSITESNFQVLLDIQKKAYELNKLANQKVLEDGLRLLDYDFGQICVQTLADLDRILTNKGQDWLKNKGFLYGFDGFKQIFWNGYFGALTPYLIKEYYLNGFRTKDFKKGIRDDGKKITQYLYKKYPKIQQILINNNLSYKSLIKEIKEAGLREKFNYSDILIVENQKPFFCFPKSVLVDLMEQIHKTDVALEVHKNMKNITKYDDKLTQKEIGKLMGKSQPTISRLIKIRNEGILKKHGKITGKL